MPVVPSDQRFANVTTYNESGLALLQNMYCGIDTFNTKFKNFNEQLPANRGSKVSFSTPPRITTSDGLEPTFQRTEQPIEELVVNEAKSSAYAFTAQQFIFEAQDFMEQYGHSAISSIGSQIEKNVLEVGVNDTYRYFGDGVTRLDSYSRLSTALMQCRNFGATPGKVKVYLPDYVVSEIISTGLNQFTIDKNNETFKSWQVGSYNGADFCQSNLLPVHIAGTLGKAGTIMTVAAIQNDADGAITGITFSGGPASDASAVVEKDRFEFLDGVPGFNNVRFRTWEGYMPSISPVQCRVTAPASTNASGEVTVNFFPKLQAAATLNQNLTSAIQVGMQVKFLPSFRMGFMVMGDAAYLAMPELPDTHPFPCSVVTDPETGISIRQYYGKVFGKDAQGMIHDTIWGKKLVPQYGFGLPVPIS